MKPSNFTREKRVKAVARVRVGQPPARRVEVPRTRRKPKHKRPPSDE